MKLQINCLSKLIKTLFFFCLVTVVVFPQAEYVKADNPVYSFLERMDALNYISGYNKFEIPKTRKEVADYLSQVSMDKQFLSIIDQKMLEDFEVEFELELKKTPPDTLLHAQTLIGGSEYDLLSEKEKYLFYHYNPQKFNIFVNLVSEGEMIFQNNDVSGQNISSGAGYVGGEIRGTILDKFGFYIRGTQGKVFGDIEAAKLKNEIKYNFKFNLEPDQAFFDETEGYVTADFDLVKFKLGRDRMNIGYSSFKPILGSASPVFDYISFNAKYEFFSFSFFHGKLLGRNFFDFDSVTGGTYRVEDKYMAYHRIGFNISKHVDFGIGETIIYGERPLDLAYLNPFIFYKSVEHSNQDRDNAMLFFDFNNNSIKGLNLYTTLLIDDINYGKIGTGWWGNQTLLNIGFYSANLYDILPLDVRFDYIRVEPYTFSHRLTRNNFTNLGYNLNSEIQPNSEVIFTQLDYRFTHRLNASFGFMYSVHGANPVDSSGDILRNVGGDVAVGRRTFDSELVTFLDGELEYKRHLFFSLSFEPVNQVFFRLRFEYTNASLQRQVSVKELNSFAALQIRI